MEPRKPSSESRVVDARNDAQIRQQILLWLETVVRKVSAVTSNQYDVDFRVLSPDSGGGGSYMIEVAKGRFARRVHVDQVMIQRRHIVQVDPLLVRDLRTAINSVVRLAQQRE